MAERTLLILVIPYPPISSINPVASVTPHTGHSPGSYS